MFNIELSKIKNFNFEIDFNFDFNFLTQDDKFINIIKFVRPNWTNLDLIKTKIYTQGSTNRLIRLFYKSKNSSDSFLIRIFGENTQLFIDREKELKNIVRLNEKNFCPPIFCTFRNGLCYGFINGKTLDVEQLLTNNQITSNVAKELARLHAEDIDDSFIKRPCLVDQFENYIKILKLPEIQNSNTFVGNTIPKLNTIFKEIDELMKILNSIDSPLVFCHNDLLMKNIIYNEIENKVHFIDYEYSGLNYQAFDIANHFCEYSGQDPFDLNLYPSEQHQFIWLKEYLTYYSKFKFDEEIEVNSVEIDKLYTQICKFSLASHLLWGIWALLQVNFSTIDFDYKKYAENRLDAYFKSKKKYLNF